MSCKNHWSLKPPFNCTLCDLWAHSPRAHLYTLKKQDGEKKEETEKEAKLKVEVAVLAPKEEKEEAKTEVKEVATEAKTEEEATPKEKTEIMTIEEVKSEVQATPEEKKPENAPAVA